MISLLAIIPVAFAAFVATNLDNLTLLVTLLAELAEGEELVLFNSVRGQYKGKLQIEDAADLTDTASLDQA